MRMDWIRFQDRIKKREQGLVEKERCKFARLDVMFICCLSTGHVPVRENSKFILQKIG